MPIICPQCSSLARSGANFCSVCGYQFTRTPQGLRAGHLLHNGDYCIVRRLGKGSFGAVYLAENQKAFKRPCVVKEMLDYYDPSNQQEAASAHRRFEEEARTLAQLNHPGIPDIQAYFSESGHNYIVMEFVEGMSLEEAVTHEDEAGQTVPAQRLTTEQVLRYGVQLCEVLEYLAGLNPPVVHQDIKPANIIIDRNRGTARLVDFGTAKARPAPQAGSTARVRQSSVFGTPGYAPPEQYQGQSEPRTDVYALAATLYHLLTDDDPSVNPPHFPQLGALPGPIQSALRPALETDVDRRCTARELRAALARALEPEPPPRRRLPLPLGAALIILPCLLIGLLLLGVRGYQANQADAVRRESATAQAAQALALETNVAQRLATRTAQEQGTATVVAQAQATRTAVAQATGAVAAQAQATADAQATATRVAQMLAQVRDTAVAQAQATTEAQGTRVVAAQVTARAQAEATALAQVPPAQRPTLDAFQAMRNRRAVTLQDDFTTNPRGWPTGDYTGQYMSGAQSLAEGKYRWHVVARESSIGSSGPRMNGLGDVYAAVEARRVAGPEDTEYGLAFRRDGNDYYVFRMSDTGYFGVEVYYHSAWATLIPWTRAEVIRSGQTNRLALSAEGGHFIFFINDRYVGAIDDTRLTSGKVAATVGLSRAGDTADVEFDNFEVRSLETSATATATAIQALRTRWPVLLQDDFASNTNGWYVGETSTDLGSRQHAIRDGKYVWQGTATSGLQSPIVPTMKNVSDVFVAVDARQVDGPTTINYGLMVRYTDKDNFYLFHISNDGRYALWLRQGGVWTQLIGPTQTDAVRPTETNRLAVQVEGGHFVLIINDQYIAAYDDTRLTSGRVGMSVDIHRGDSATLEFDNLEIHAP